MKLQSSPIKKHQMVLVVLIAILAIFFHFNKQVIMFWLTEGILIGIALWFMFNPLKRKKNE